ncbi:PH domain leucine-rich repeat-containing protein phosphatase 2 [Aphidius gifuensis]|nr:PH domain leucine-rich repeat-containing protein phosphatase 2 [Aphidius gifuensis]
MSRKKRQIRKKIDDNIIKNKTGNCDLTGTVRRRWIPNNEKIDDSISQRLELIHELNQKILKNYEKIQLKSKQGHVKTVRDKIENSNGTLRMTSTPKNRIALQDIKDNKEQLYSEIKIKNKQQKQQSLKSKKTNNNNKKIIEKVMIHKCDNDELDSKKNTLPISTSDKLESIKMKKSMNIAKSIINFGTNNKIKNKNIEINDNFSLSVKPEFNIDNYQLNKIHDKINIPIKTIIDIPNDEKNKSIDENNKITPKNPYLSSANNDDSNDNDEKIIKNLNNEDFDKIVNTNDESTKNLEKEILDNLNETIGKFDNDKNSVDICVDEGRGEDDDDNLSDDSIKFISTKLSCSKDESHQETFNSSWDSGVGIDVGSGSGWVRIHTGIESSLVYLTLDTTAKDICRDMLLGDELSLYIQYGGKAGRRMGPDEKPLEHQDNFLKQIGFDNITRRARLGVDPELRYLIAFHVGPTEPTPDLTGYSRCGNVLILKGLVFPQWKRRAIAVIGSRLFLYPGCQETQPEWIELNGGTICYAPSRLGKLVLRVTGYPRIIHKEQNKLENSDKFQANKELISSSSSSPSSSSQHDDSRHIYLGFHHPWDRDLWRSWLKQATKTSNSPKKLELSNAGLSKIPDSILAFHEVEEILLDRNSLTTIASNLSILRRFPQLKLLQLEHNQLTTIPRELLELVCLTSLNLSNNKIDKVPAEIYRLVNLKELILDRNGIKELPAEIGLLKELKSISAAGNNIEILPIFLNMRALNLDILTKTDYGKYKDERNNQNNLQKVNLRNNQLKGNIILGNYGNLTHLDLSENSIEKLDISALQELQSARCARNLLTELTLCGKNLVSLIAGNNKLKKLTIEPIPTNLEHLDVSYNCLDTLPEWIPELPVLRALFASHNDLTALPDRLLSQPSRLEVLHLPHNRLQALPPPRKPLNIVHLTLQGNALTALPSTFFQNTERMKVLNLSNNRLSELPYTENTNKNQQNSHTLEKFYLTGNCLTDTALDALAKLPALRVLHLAYNILDTLPESCIASWPDLEELVLSGNRLQYLPDNVANLQHLRVLRVHSNRLLTCPTFNKTTSLMVLDLAHNQLDRVNLATLVPPQLQFLDISCNSRLHVDPRQFQVYRSQRQISLIDVSGQNRPSLPSHPQQQEIVSNEKGPEQPWRLGFSETAGTREKLYVSQVRMPSFCNVEGLFGIFDGDTNQEAPTSLQEMIPRLLLEEKTIRETSKDYLKYTLLSAHRELKEKGQKYGVDSTLIHITKLPMSPNYSRTTKKYILKVVSSGDTKAVLCRADGPLLLSQRKKIIVKNQLGNSSMFPLVLPDPITEEIILEDDDEFIIIANRKLWDVLTIQEAVREARAEESPVLAAKRLQDLAQAYGAEDNLSIIVIRLTGQLTGDYDLLMRELRHAVSKNKNNNNNSNNCSCPCCIPPSPHKLPTQCCCHNNSSSGGNNNDGFYTNGVLKNIVNHKTSVTSRNGSGRYFKNLRNCDNTSPQFNDDRSSPSGQSDQTTTDSTFKTRQTSGRAWIGNTASRALSKNRHNILHDNTTRKNDTDTNRSAAAVAAATAALSEEQFRCWEYMLEQNTHMLFDKELDTLTRIPLRRGQSRSTPHLANLPFLSKRFGSARSFNPPLPRPPMMRFGSGRRYLNGGPNAAYFGSLQRLMPYNLEYDFAVIQERGGIDSLEQDASRMQQYWGVATTEL